MSPSPDTSFPGGGEPITRPGSAVEEARIAQRREPPLADLHRTLADLECYARLAAAGGLRSNSPREHRSGGQPTDVYAAVDQLSERGDATRARQVWALLCRVAGPDRRVLLWLADRGGSRPDADTVATLFAREFGPLELREELDAARRSYREAVATYAAVGPGRGRALTQRGALARDRLLQSLRVERAAGTRLRDWGMEHLGRAVSTWMSISKQKA